VVILALLACIAGGDITIEAEPATSEPEVCRDTLHMIRNTPRDGWICPSGKVWRVEGFTHRPGGEALISCHCPKATP